MTQTMFTQDQIKAAHAKVKSGADYPRYVRDLKKLGIHHYDYVVENGANVYYDHVGNHLSTRLDDIMHRNVSDISSSEMLKEYIVNHQQGNSDFPTFCLQAAKAGVQRWSSDLEKMVCTYYDKMNNEMYAEPIPEVAY